MNAIHAGPCNQRNAGDCWVLTMVALLTESREEDVGQIYEFPNHCQNRHASFRDLSHPSEFPDADDLGARLGGSVCRL